MPVWGPICRLLRPRGPWPLILWELMAMGKDGLEAGVEAAQDYKQEAPGRHEGLGFGIGLAQV